MSAAASVGYRPEPIALPLGVVVWPYVRPTPSILWRRYYGHRRPRSTRPCASAARVDERARPTLHDWTIIGAAVPEDAACPP